MGKKDNSEHQHTSSCCSRWLSISKIYGRFFITKESQHDDDDDNDGIEKEGISLLEDNVMEELQELREELEERNNDIETILQKVGP